MTLSALMPPGLYPFWFWNDRLEADEIREQVRQMAAQGIKGFFIHSRQGLAQPYLSDAFMDMVAAALEEAKAQGLTVHLYDEFPYPSGVGGGEVILGQPEFHATELVQRSYDLPAGPLRLELPPGKLLYARAYPLRDGVVDWSAPLDLRRAVGMSLVANSYVETGLTTYNQKRYFASRPTPTLETRLPAGEWRVFAGLQVEVSANKYWGHFVDALNPAAVQAFIQATGEPYLRRFGAEFGKTILSMFTDETAPGWSARLPRAFETEYGYDLLSCLEALTADDHPRALQVRADFDRLRARLFVEAFDQPIAEWRQAHGLAHCGEKPSTRLSQLQWMDIPGCEPAHTKVGRQPDLLQPNPRGNARATASAAYFYGKIGALDECFHSMGWGGTLQDARFLTDAMLLMGIRFLVPHGFFYSTHNLRKHDAPPSFFIQTPTWPLFGRLSAYVDLLMARFEGTHIAAQVLILDPTAGLPNHEDKLAYVRLQQELLAAHYDFMQVDTDLLQAAHVTADGSIRLREVQARVLIVPPMQYSEPELSTWLDQYEQQGGCVLRLASDFETGQVLDQVSVRAAPGLQIRAEGQNDAAVWCVRRETANGDRTLWFVLNTTAQPLELTIRAGQALHEVVLEDGGSPTLISDGTAQVYTRQTAPFESFLLESGLAPTRPLPRLDVLLGGAAQVNPQQANLLRLGDWQLELLDDGGKPTASARVSAVPLANQLASSGLPFAPEFIQRFGLAPELRLPTLHARYRASFRADMTDGVELVMEPDSIVGDWQVWVNQAGPFLPADFRPTRAHVRGSLGLDISAALMPGENELRVDLITDRLDGGLLNPLYLAGTFGVDLSGSLPGLYTRGADGIFEDYRANGLPYYAGVIEYQLDFTVDEIPAGPQVAVTLETAPLTNDAIEVSINGSDFQPVLWQPRRVILPTDVLHSGSNRAVVRLYTTLIRAFEGTRFDQQTHGYQEV